MFSTYISDVIYDKAMWNQSVRLTILYKIQSGDIQKQTRLLNGLDTKRSLIGKF